MEKHILENVNAYLATKLNITESEFNAMLDHSTYKNVALPSDTKVALNNAIKANRLLSSAYAKVCSQLDNQEELISAKQSEIVDIMNRHIKELKGGKFPLSDRDTLLEEFKVSEKEKEEAKKPDSKPVVPAHFLTKYNDSSEIPFTSVDISAYTSIPDLVKATPTAIKEAAKTAATREAAEAMRALKTAKSMLNNLLNGVHKEMSSLDSIGRIVSSEQYGTNRLGSLEKKTEGNKSEETNQTSSEPRKPGQW